MEFMGFKREIRKVAELGIGAVAIGTLILAGCGGGGGSSSSSTTTTPTPIAAYKGIFTTGVANVYDASGNTVATNIAIASGVGSVNIPSTAVYPLVVAVSGTYVNEITGKLENTTTPLRGIVSSVAATGIPVTALTELAVAQIEKTAGSLTAPHASSPITATQAALALNNISTELGYDATAVPSFNADGSPKDSNTKALNLLAWGLSQASVGVPLSTALNNLSAQWATPASAVSAMQGILNTLSAVNPNVSTSVYPNTGLTVPTAPTTATAPQAINVVSATAGSQIATATTLLNTLHTNFIQQASGVQADLNNITSPFQEAQNFELFLSQGMTLASNGKATGSRITVNGYPCVLLSLTGGTGTVVCQWSGNYGSASPAIHQLTVTGPNNTTAGVYTLTPIGTYTWSDTIVPTASLSISGASSVSATGITAATGTVNGTAAGVTLSGSILPGEGVTSSHTSTTITNLVVTETQNTSASTNTFGITGTIAELNGTASIDSLTLASGTQLVQDATTGHTVSATLVTQAATQNYSFNGTLTLTNFAQDLKSSTNSLPGWNPGTSTFTGSVSNATLGKFLTTTGTGLTVTSDWTKYDPTQAQSSTNFPTESGTLAGNLLNGTASYAVNLTFASGTTSANYNTITAGVTLTDSSSNAVTVSETGTTSGLATTAATLGTNNSGSVYFGAAATGTAIGTITGGVVTFTDLSTLSLK